MPQKSEGARANMQSLIKNPMERVRYWVADELKVSWG